MSNDLPVLFNVGDYQPIGTLRLCLNHPQRPSVSGFNPHWQEAESVHQALPLDHPCFESLGRLLEARWANVTYRLNSRDRDWGAVRFHLLPDDVGRIHLDRSSKALRGCLRQILPLLDLSSAAWNADYDPRSMVSKFHLDTGEDVSLFYLFNTLRSPAPRVSDVAERHSREAMKQLLSRVVPTLKTPLYAYQRRSAASMLRKEVAPSYLLDPRLQSMTAPDGSTLFYDQEACIILSEPRFYEGARGGILAETMGLGKTIMCLALIAATRDHWPVVPVEYIQGDVPPRAKTGTLLEMCAAAAARHGIPSRDLFDRLEEEGIHYVRCRETLFEHAASYIIPPPAPRRLSRTTALPSGQRVRLSTGTVVICPANLVQQWINELDKHLEQDSLRTLVMADHKKELPEVAELLRYDLILFSRRRFEDEVRDGTDNAGRRAPHGQERACSCPIIDQARTVDCTCFRPEEVYRSPLLRIHFKRLIVDEGHYHGNSDASNAAVVAQCMKVERRWVVSGTPANGLIGVEVGLAALPTQSPTSVEVALERRKDQRAVAQELKDLDRIGNIISRFLKVRPWSNKRDEEPASWNHYMKPTNGRGRRVKSHCLRSVLEDLVVKHRPEDVGVELPPLTNRIVHLNPSFYDRLSINLFLMTLVANAVTSEREGADYLFHPKNRTALNQLVNNLRQSGFYWTGFSESDVSNTVSVGKGYLEDKSTHCSAQDRALLEEAIQIGQRALADGGWQSFSRFQELGFSVQDFPHHENRIWALDGSGSNPTVIGASQLSLAQKEVQLHSYAADPGAGLASAGINAMDAARSSFAIAANKTVQINSKGVVNLSNATAETLPSRKRRHSSAGGQNFPVTKSVPNPADAEPVRSLPPSSPLRKTRIRGVASAKLAYLIDQILILYQAEKILVAYEGDHIAYYVAQALDILGINYLIYARTLETARRAQYIVTFNTTETFRVLLMDVHQASHGLNLSSASRVFFVNPIWQPDVEAQAVKRAHRIGQTRPVVVETLVLRGTLEDQMLQRRSKMGHDEHEETAHSLLDDHVMSAIIKNASFLPISDDKDTGPMAQLRVPQQVFGRDCATSVSDPDADLVEIASAGPSRSKTRCSKTVGFSDAPPELQSKREANEAPLESLAGGMSACSSPPSPSVVIFEMPRGKGKKKMRFAEEDINSSSAKAPKTAGTSVPLKARQRKKRKSHTEGRELRRPSEVGALEPGPGR